MIVDWSVRRDDDGKDIRLVDKHFDGNWFEGIDIVEIRQLPIYKHTRVLQYTYKQHDRM